MVDYDLPGIKIASETPTSMPWIGVNDETLKSLHLTRDEVSIPAESNQYERYITKLIEDGEHLINSKNDNAGKADTRFEGVDLEFLKDRRIEIDAILAKVGAERFFEFIMHELNALSPTRNYNRAIDISIEFYNKDAIDILPTPVKTLLEHIQNISDAAAAKSMTEIRSRLTRVEGFLEVQNKKKEFKTQIAESLMGDEGMKKVSTKCEELLSETEEFNDDTPDNE
jgi:hypothetical protein